MSGLQQFDYGNWSVRTFVAADGQPWFVAADVCAALGFANRGQALATHVDPVDRGVHPVDTPGGTQNAVVINESGLYALAFGSRLETARTFKRWVTSDDPAISVGSVKLMAELRRLGWVDAKNVPYQSQITAGRMRRKSSTYIDPFGEEQVSITARLTVKGVRDLHRRLGGSQLPALALVSGGSL